MKHATSGFTLIELMTTLAVLAVVLAIGMPAMASIRKRAQASAALNQLTTSLATARIMAVSKNRSVTLCPSSDGSTCRTDLNWGAGWIIYLDPAREAQPASSDLVMQRMDAPKGVSIRSTVGRHRVRYLPDGMSSGTNVSLSLCSTTDKQLIGRVVINNAGRARSEKPTSATACPYSL